MLLYTYTYKLHAVHFFVIIDVLGIITKMGSFSIIDYFSGTISGIYFASAMVALALIACFTAVILRFTKRKAAIITTQHR